MHRGHMYVVNRFTVRSEPGPVAVTSRGGDEDVSLPHTPVSAAPVALAQAGSHMPRASHRMQMRRARVCVCVRDTDA